MLKRTVPGFLLLSLCAILPAAVYSQDCQTPPITANAKLYNIFSPEQEMVLGELTYQRISRNMRFIKDSKVTSYINRIGDNLIKRLPATGLEFKFLIVDIPEANAFNVPGGYVFLSRKLIAFAKSEDEIAGVMAHELGHATVRHGASSMSEMLKKVLNVTQVGDRKDIIEKYNLLIERQRTKRITSGSGHESEQQLEADRIGLYAMIASGYDPKAYASLFDRLVETKGKTGGWFSDFFGSTKPEEKRLREMLKAAQRVPPQCQKRQTSNVDEFLQWQAEVVSYRDPDLREELPGLLWKRELSPRLRSDISHFSFSPDGKYFLAQDDFAITVVEREPLRVHFQIPAPDARPAEFTPDNNHVIFSTDNLRFEKWSVIEKKPVEMRELVVLRDCREQEFSPDGKYLACIDGSNITLLDTQTGEKVWEKKEFYRLSFLEYLALVLTQHQPGEDVAPRFFNIEFSTDSRFLLISRSNHFRFLLSINGVLADASSEDRMMALDLMTMKPVSVGGDLKKALRRPFVFLEDKRILGMEGGQANQGGFYSFPEGRRLAQFEFAGEEIKRTANPDLIIVKPMSNADLGVFDLKTVSILTGMNKTDVALWKNLMIYQTVSGQVQLSDTHYDDQQKSFQGRNLGIVDIPVAAIANLSAAEVSNNFQWLALSSKTRGAVWSLTSGERKLFLRGFRGVLMANDGAGIADFPKLEPIKHSLVFLNPLKGVADVLREIPESGTRQHGRFLLIQKSLKEAKKQDAKGEKDKPDNRESEESHQTSLRREVRFELRDIIGDKLVWSRDFPKEAPRFFFDEFSGRLIFYWTLGSEAGKSKLKEDPVVAARSNRMGNKDDDYLLEVVDAFAAKTIGTLLIETGKGSFDIQSGYSDGNWLVLHDSENRVLAFSISDGDLHGRFFGSKVTINPAGNSIAVENNPGEITLYDLNTSEPTGRLLFKKGAAFTRFSLDGKKLFVLTEDQTAYAFELDKIKADSASVARQ